MTTFTTEDREGAEKMNALELADNIATCEPNLGRVATDCANMLRQQEAELARLKEDNAELQRLFNKAMDEWAKDQSK
jgi:hypothetical protein